MNTNYLIYSEKLGKKHDWHFNWITKKRIKLSRLCPTYQAVDFVLKYSTKNGCDNTGSAITVKREWLINECKHFF